MTELEKPSFKLRSVKKTPPNLSTTSIDPKLIGKDRAL
jgi:hypothetical protein